jgi:hypothetical protein
MRGKVMIKNLVLKENDERQPGRPRKSWDFNFMMDIREIY